MSGHAHPCNASPDSQRRFAQFTNELPAFPGR